MSPQFAIIGCGRIAQRHAEQIIKHGNLKAVCDVVPEKATALGNKYGATTYTSIENLLSNEPTLDLISICTPNGLHAIHSILALQAGINVLCEKPLCINYEDGKKMIDAAQKASKKLLVVKQNRFNPPVAYVKELIINNQLGRIYSFQINCFWNRPDNYYIDWKGTKDLDGGTLYTQFSHFIDLLYWLLGDVQHVSAIKKNFAHSSIDFEDTGIVNFEMLNGSIGNLNYNVNATAKNMEGSITIFAEKGTVKIGGEYLNELEYFNVRGIATPNLTKGNPANKYGSYQGSMSNHDKVYENIILSLQQKESNLASAEDGLKTVEIIEKIYSSFL